MSKTSKGTRLLRTRSGRSIGVNGQHLGNHSKRIVYNKPLNVQKPRVSPLITKIFLASLVAIVAACIFAIAVSAQSSDPGMTVSGPNWVGDGSCEIAGEIRWFRDRYVSSKIKFVGDCPTPVDWQFSSPDRTYSGSKLLDDLDGEEFLIGGTWDELENGDLLILQMSMGDVTLPGVITEWQDEYPVLVRYQLYANDKGQACRIGFDGDIDPWGKFSDGINTYVEHLISEPWYSPIYDFPNVPVVTWDVWTYNDEELTQERSHFQFGPFQNPCYISPTLTPSPTVTLTPTITATPSITPTPGTTTPTPTLATPGECVSLEVSLDLEGDHVINLTVIGTGAWVRIYREETQLSVSEGNFDTNSTFYGYDSDVSEGPHNYKVYIDDVEYPNCRGSVTISSETPTPEVEVTPTSVPCSPLYTVEVFTNLGELHRVRLELSNGAYWEGDTNVDGVAGPTSLDPSVSVTAVSIDGAPVSVTTDDPDGQLPTNAPPCGWRKIFVSPNRPDPTTTPVASPTPSRSINALASTGAREDLPGWFWPAVIILITILVIFYRRSRNK